MCYIWFGYSAFRYHILISEYDILTICKSYQFMRHITSFAFFRKNSLHYY